MPLIRFQTAKPISASPTTSARNPFHVKAGRSWCVFLGMPVRSMMLSLELLPPHWARRYYNDITTISSAVKGCREGKKKARTKKHVRAGEGAPSGESGATRSYID